jgi:hypothetical protein
VESKRFKVIFSPSAQKDIELLETDTAIQIVKDIQSYLEVFPLSFGKRRNNKVTAFDPPLYRLRSGTPGPITELSPMLLSFSPLPTKRTARRF